MATQSKNADLRLLPVVIATWDQKAQQIVERVGLQSSLKDALQCLVEQMLLVLDAARCFVIEFDKAGEPLPIAIEALANAHVKSFKGAVPPWNVCPFLKQVRQKQFTYSFDTLESLRSLSDQLWYEHFDQNRIRGFMASPIIYEGEIQCVLVMHTQEPRFWSDAALLFAQICSNQAAASVFRFRAAHFYKQLLASENRYQTLYEWEKKAREILSAMREFTESDGATPLALELMVEALGMQQAFILEYASDSGQCRSIEHLYSNTQKQMKWESLNVIEELQRLPDLTTLGAQKELYVSGDVHQEPLWDMNPLWKHFYEQYRIRSFMAYPLFYKDVLLRVLLFSDQVPRVWSEQELFFVKVVGAQLSAVFYQEKVREELLEATQMKSDFLSKMSHELRTPLNAILGYTRMVEKGLVGSVNQKQTEYLGYVYSSAQHLLNLVNDILDFSKIEAHKMTLYFEPIDLWEMIQEIQGMVGGLASTKNIHVDFQIQPGVVAIQADRGRLKQILLNLVSNAIKFNKAEGSVMVRFYETEEQGTWLVGQVQDTGIGIPSAKLPELFNKFYQVDTSASRKHEGTGLGLVLTKELLALHGGDITVESQEGIGTTFTFRIPITP